MIYFYRRGYERQTYEIRLATAADGYELIVTINGHETTERFRSIHHLLAREHELTTAWRALGWQDASARRLDPAADATEE
jgi:hypothetical protein